MPDQLISGYDALLLDLDGVVYRGGQPVVHAPESLSKARERTTIAYVTNNASRTPEQVARRLGDMGIVTSAHDVVTSAQAGARLLLERGHKAGQPVLVIGGEGLRSAVEARGFRVVDSATDSPVAVIQGFSPDIGWKRLAEATFAVRGGADFVATNTDLSIPTDRGIAPGNGILVNAVASTVGVTPAVAGKPETPLMVESVERVGAHHPLVVGDRLDTDIAGAVKAGIDSLLVFTGVTDVEDLLNASTEMRPTYIGLDLRALFEPPVAVGANSDTASTAASAPWLAAVAAACWRVWNDSTIDATSRAEIAASLGAPTDH